MNTPDTTSTAPHPILTRAEISALLGRHRQVRPFSCFQSAPEMWLKLNAVIDWAAYPEQSLPQNDGRGYEPYPDGGTKNYNGVDIAFRKETFHAPYVTLFDKLTAELASGRFVVVSLRPPGNAGWHGYLVTEKDGGDFVVFSKNGPTEKDTVEDRLSNRLSTREKVDCLFMEIVKTVRP